MKFKVLPLTDRHLECLDLLSKGYTGKEIARIIENKRTSTIGITYNTYRVYIKEIRERLGAFTVAHAISIAFRRGLIT